MDNLQVVEGCCMRLRIRRLGVRRGLLVKELYRNHQLARVITLHEVVNSEVQLAAIWDPQERARSRGKQIRYSNT